MVTGRVLETRRAAFESFLQAVGAYEALSRNAALLRFLGCNVVRARSPASRAPHEQQQQHQQKEEEETEEVRFRLVANAWALLRWSWRRCRLPLMRAIIVAVGVLVGVQAACTSSPAEEAVVVPQEEERTWSNNPLEDLVAKVWNDNT